MKIIWSEPAEDDLDALFDHIVRDSPINAEQFTRRIVSTMDALAATPRIGRIVPEAGIEHLRQRIVQSQRVVYAIIELSMSASEWAIRSASRSSSSSNRLISGSAFNRSARAITLSAECSFLVIRALHYFVDRSVRDRMTYRLGYVDHIQW